MTTPTLADLPAGILPASPVTRIRVLIGEDDDDARRGTKTVVAARTAATTAQTPRPPPGASRRCASPTSGCGPARRN